ncbi:Hint domain-containing protein [Candidatus Rhodobacter oscarellae]|uniref:Hint domain-containing protein n=1 Tax=Candidatus Rhodobacter oscarellae TaxID=1675527 RepID=UPI00128F7697|nr:Hint domain-containing protein [Candidatus Rhodobacter lobularis]
MTGLVGLWDFINGNANADTGLADGIAQNGAFEGNAGASGDRAHFDGHGDRFDVIADDDDDDVFDNLDKGTIEVQFTQDSHIGSSPDTLVSRGEYEDAGDDGYFSISVLANGAVQVIHCNDNGDEEILTTSAGLVDPGDLINVKYSWDINSGVTLEVENLDDGSTASVNSSQTGLSMDIGDDDASFTFGARENDDDDYDRFFDGSIDYVAIYESGEPPVVDPNGVVDGEADGEVMELGYDDSNAPTDQGGDLITEDADVIFGNGGDDTISGAGGNDTIYGDSGTDGAPAREIFEWSEAAGFGNNVQTTGFSQDTGSTTITFDVESQSSGVDTQFETELQNTQDLDAGVGAQSSLESILNGNANSALYSWTSEEPIQNVEFRINDIDGDGRVVVRAYDEFGNEIPVTLSDAGSGLTLSGNTASSNDDDYTQDSAFEHSVLVTIAGPVASWTVEHQQDGGNNTGINVTDIAFDVNATFGEPGDDVITGGDGADEMYGEDGDDTFIVASGAEGDGDVITGGNGPDDSADNDTLDLRGAGQVTINASADGSDDGAQSGTVTFSDGSMLTFSQIETILTDPQNEAPTANDDTVNVDEDQSVTFNPTANDTDPDGDPLEVTSISDPANGTLTDNGDGTYTYEPDPNYNGPDSVTYTIQDPSGETSTATVTFNVAPVNDDPVANDDSGSTLQGTPVEVNLLGNDTDVDGDTLEIASVSVPASQGAVVDNGNGTVTFTPAVAFVGDAEITYTVSDGNGGSDTGTATVTVTDVIGPVDGLNSGEVMAPGYTDVEGDMIDGTDGDNDTIFGNGGDDTIDSGVGDDTVYGGAGDDVFVLADDAENIDNDVIIGGETDEDDGGDLLDASDFEDDLTVDITAPETGTITDGVDTTTFEEIEMIETGSGDDTVMGSTGDDYVQTNGGDDSVVGGDGNDTLLSGDGEDTLEGGDGDDSLVGGDEADTIMGGDGADTIDGGRGGDELDGGAGDDSILGGNDDDTITGGDGADTVDGGDGDNLIDTSGSAPLLDDKNGDGFGFGPYGPLPGLIADSNENDDRDLVTAGSGDDTIITGDDDDTIIAGSGDNVIDAGIDDDSITSTFGDDFIVGGEGSDTISAGAGDDTIYGGLDPAVVPFDGADIPDDGSFPNGGDPDPENGRDYIEGGAGNDLIYGQDDDDTILGGGGADTIFGGVDDDSILGGNSKDDIYGGQGADTMRGENDRDEFFIDEREHAFGDVVDGGTGGNDVDTLDLRGLGRLQVVGETVDADGDSTSGTVNFLAADGSVEGSLEFTEIERLIICFTPGARIATPRGEISVEDLHVGDRVITRDDGVQAINWIGSKKVTGKDLLADPKLRPVLIKKGALGNNLPERDMMVSPNHRMLVANSQTQVLFDEREVLVAAKHLVGQPGVHQIDTLGTEYIHVMFDRHQVILGDGAWTESFQPGDHSLSGIDADQRDEIFTLFPELQSRQGRRAYGSARQSLKAHEARMLRQTMAAE